MIKLLKQILVNQSVILSALSIIIYKLDPPDEFHILASIKEMLDQTGDIITNGDNFSL